MLSCWLELKCVSAALLSFTNLQPYVSCKYGAPSSGVPRLWSCYWLISVMSAPGSRKEEVTSNLPLCSPRLQILLLGCQLKPLEQLLHHMGEAGESEETWPPLRGCSLTALFIFNCQKSPLILSSPLCVIRSVVVVLQPEPSLRLCAHYPCLKTIPYVNIFLFKKFISSYVELQNLSIDMNPQWRLGTLTSFPMF